MKRVALLIVVCLTFVSSNVLFGQNSALRVFRLAGSDVHRYPSRMVFTRDGKLIIVYRLPKSKDDSSALRLLAVDPVTGRQVAARSHDVPYVGRVRIPDSFVLNREGSSIYYAELQPPEVVLALDVATLDVFSRSTKELFVNGDFLPHIAGSTAESLLMAAESALPDQNQTANGAVPSGTPLAQPSYFLTARAIHIVAVDARDVSRTSKNLRFEKRDWPVGVYALSHDGNSIWIGSATYLGKFGLESDNPESSTLRAKEPVSQLFALSNSELGITDNQVKGWLQLFDQHGHETQMLYEADCGFVTASFSSDEKYGVAICDRTGMGEADFGKTRERKAVVFDTQKLAFISAIPLPTQSLRAGAGTPQVRTAYPLPAIWHDGRRLLIAVPDWSGAVILHALTIP